MHQPQRVRFDAAQRIVADPCSVTVINSTDLRPFVVRVNDDSDAAGIGIFALDEAETHRVIESDRAVVAGVFVAEYHPVLGFPDDTLADPA